MKVAILGAGISAILSRWACIEHGIVPDMYAKEIPSMKGGGVKFIHSDCNISGCLYSEVINCFKTNEGYKKYEEINDIDSELDKYRIKISGEKVEDHMKLKYSEPAVLWRSIESSTYFDPDEVKIAEFNRKDILDMEKHYDLIISTIPLFIVFPELKDKCTIRYGYVKEEKPECFNENQFDFLNLCIYNNTDDEWYRASKVFGYWQTEYVNEVENSNKIVKVKDGPKIEQLQDNGKLFLTGRYGTWNKSALAHDSYKEVTKLLNNILAEHIVNYKKYEYKGI